MKRLFLLLAVVGMIFTACESGGDDVSGGDNTQIETPDDAYITLNTEVITFSPDGDSVNINVYSNYAWKLTSNCDWVTTSITGGEASEQGTTITLTADLTYDDREGTIIFSCGKAKRVLLVSQSFKEAIVADENNVFNVPANGGNIIINYQTNVECEVIIPKEAQSWIALTPNKTRSLVRESTTLTVAENTTYSERSAIVKVVKVNDNTLFTEYIINQVQSDTIIAENNTFNVPANGGNVIISYQTNVECEVIIPKEVQNWVSLVPATRSLVSESATLNIADNNTGAERSAVVKVAATNNNKLVAEYTITQNKRCIIEYTSTNGSPITLDQDRFNATILRNEYVNGKGYIEFSIPITSINSYAFYECTSLKSITIPDSVTWIGYRAFKGCTSLTSVTIPDSVTSIGEEVFHNCNSLTSVHITDIAAWYNIDFAGYAANPLHYAKNLYLKGELVTNLIIPNGVTTIRDYAFSRCTSLTSVTIPDSVTEIGMQAFYGCTSLKSITIPDSVTSIGNDAFNGCTSLTSVTIGNGVTSIGEEVFYQCTSLTSVTIGNSVTEIGEKAFYSCTSLTSVTIPDSVTSIGDEAFRNCTSLTSVTIGNGVTKIGMQAFRGCTSLTSVTIGNSVTEIVKYAFYNCSSLTSVTIPDSVTEIGKYAFYGCYSVTITIPDSVTEIGEGAFGNCTGELIISSKIVETDYIYNYSSASNDWLDDSKFYKITIGKGITKIGKCAFFGCSSLTNVFIPDSATSIGDYAFSGCASLAILTIGKGVTSIGKEAFKECYSFYEIYCKPTTPPTLHSSLRSNDKLKLYVPRASVNTYISSDWYYLKSYIQPYDFQ